MAKDVPFIRCIASSRDGGTDALLGFSVSVPSQRIAKNEDAYRHYQEVLQRQVEVIRALWNSGIAALDLRFIGAPDASEARIGLLCNIYCPSSLADWQVQNYCQNIVLRLQRWFAEIGYTLVPLTDEASLSRYLSPFPLQALSEIRRHEKALTIEDAYTEYEVYLTYPWEWAIQQPLSFSTILTRQPGDWLVSVHLRPTRLSREEQAHLDHANSPGIGELLASIGPEGLTLIELYRSFAQRLQQPYMLRISIAASQPQTLQHCEQAILSKLHSLQQSGTPAVAQGPQNQQQWQAMQHNLLTLGWAAWGNQRDNVAHTARLRYLVDSQGASMAFHLPSFQQTETTSTHKIKVLLIFANPQKTDPLYLGREDRIIHEAIQRSRYRDNIEIQVRHAATIHDFSRALLEDEYQIIHLAGHGTHEGFLLEDEVGRAFTVLPQALARRLQNYYEEHKLLRCVILNACYTIEQGRHIAQGVSAVDVIGMEGSLGDKAAREFARGFYDALGAGKEIGSAYREGCDRADLAAPYSSIVAHIFRKHSS